MKKFFKALALVLALALVIGVVPAQATSAKIKAKKTLYVDGAKGASTDGTKTSGYKGRVAIYKLAGAKKADKEDHTFRAKIKSGESVTVSKNYVYAADLGKSVVEIFKDGESLGTTVVTVKKNATDDTLTITEFEDGKEVVCGVEYTVTLPRKGVDTDERRLFVDDKAQTEVEGQPRVYKVKFKTAGDHKVKAEAFQSAELDKATATKEITVKAVMPTAESAKQVTANSFAVTFTGDMTDLVNKDNITNDMVYYLIADKPVVTGVVKDVKVEKEVVTITMYSNFASDRDYYFSYGNTDAVKFHTAKNDIKYATEMRLIKADAYYVGANTPVVYKFYNADGVELAIEGQSATLSYDSEVAYLIGEEIYFFKEGTATIKAVIITGYDETTNDPIKLEATLDVTGVTKTATQTSKVYSFGTDASKKVSTIRLTNNGAADAVALKVEYTLSDGTKQPLDSTNFIATSDYYLRSVDETVAMITGPNKNLVYGVNEGKTYIVLCDKDGKDQDVFEITVLGKNKVSNATTIDLNKDTLNLWAGANDSIKLTIQGIDLDSAKNGAYTYSIEQATNNADAVKVEFTGKTAGYVSTGIDGNGKFEVSYVPANFTDNRGAANVGGVAVVRLAVNVKNVDGTIVASKTVQFAVSNQNAADAWKISASKSALDASIKDWGDANPADEISKITAESVKMVGGYPFHIANDSFCVVTSTAGIPVSKNAVSENYVVVSYPTGTNAVTTTATATQAALDVTLTAFPGYSTQGTTGTYTFTGIHVKYDSANNYIGTRTPMGTVSVVISKSDVAGKADVILGTAKAFKEKVANVALPNAAIGNTVKDIFKVTWAGLATDDTTPRVVIKSVNYSYDTSTDSYYVSSVKAEYTLSKTNGNYKFQKDVAVGKLFKDK